MQIVPELVTNADAAIAASGRSRGRIEVRFGAPAPAFLAAWRAQMRALRVPALRSWRFEASCADDGVGVNAAIVDRRLGALGELPEHPELLPKDKTPTDEDDPVGGFVHSGGAIRPYRRPLCAGGAGRSVAVKLARARYRALNRQQAGCRRSRFLIETEPP